MHFFSSHFTSCFVFEELTDDIEDHECTQLLNKYVPETIKGVTTELRVKENKTAQRLFLKLVQINFLFCEIRKDLSVINFWLSVQISEASVCNFRQCSEISKWKVQVHVEEE